jgi:hypothetical protein
MIQLEKLFVEHGCKTPVQRAAFVKWMLDNNKRARPFYYREYKDRKVPIVCDTLLILLHSLWVLQGIFQSRILLMTLATHYTAIATISKDNCSTEKPVAALILSIQAVHHIVNSHSVLILCQVTRALLLWKSGRKEVPSGPAGYFSKTNWDNHVKRVSRKHSA